MQETCKCGENKIRTETDGKFAYQTCDNCKDVINIIYLGGKDEDKEIIDYDEEILGL
jgi:hypothetical protein